MYIYIMDLLWSLDTTFKNGMLDLSAGREDAIHWLNFGCIYISIHLYETSSDTVISRIVHYQVKDF